VRAQNACLRVWLHLTTIVLQNVETRSLVFLKKTNNRLTQGGYINEPSTVFFPWSFRFSYACRSRPSRGSFVCGWARRMKWTVFQILTFHTILTYLNFDLFLCTPPLEIRKKRNSKTTYDGPQASQIAFVEPEVHHKSFLKFQMDVQKSDSSYIRIMGFFTGFQIHKPFSEWQGSLVGRYLPNHKPFWGEIPIISPIWTQNSILSPL
jgi:hypothetical protein